MEEKEFIPFIIEVENDIYAAIKKDFVKKLKEISNYASESFKKGFWYNEGIPRMWNKMTESEIDQLFEKYKGENSIIFDMFKEFRLVKNPLKCI
jgi:hypothetical protein